MAPVRPCQQQQQGRKVTLSATPCTLAVDRAQDQRRISLLWVGCLTTQCVYRHVWFSVGRSGRQDSHCHTAAEPQTCFAQLYRSSQGTKPFYPVRGPTTAAAVASVCCRSSSEVCRHWSASCSTSASRTSSPSKPNAHRPACKTRHCKFV